MLHWSIAVMVGPGAVTVTVSVGLLATARIGPNVKAARATYARTNISANVGGIYRSCWDKEYWGGYDPLLYLSRCNYAAS